MHIIFSGILGMTAPLKKKRKKNKEIKGLGAVAVDFRITEHRRFIHE